jgi:hypothetical protein
MFVVTEAYFVAIGVGEQFSTVEVHAPGKDSVAQIDLLHQNVVLQLSSVDILSRAIGGLHAGPPLDLRQRCSPKVQHLFLSTFTLPVERISVVFFWRTTRQNTTREPSKFACGTW